MAKYQLVSLRGCPWVQRVAIVLREKKIDFEFEHIASDIVGVVTGDDRLFQYGIGAYVAALASMNPDGSLPHEMARGARALQ